MTYYSTITKESFNTICVAFPDSNGVDTKKGLMTYEENSNGNVNVIFVDTKKNAVDLLKSF